MPKKRYYSKTRWRTQPRDRNGRWTSRLGGAAKRAVFSGTSWDRGAEVNFGNQSASGGLSVTKKLLGGYKMTGSLGLSIQPSGASPMERLVGAASEAVGRRLAGGANRLFRMATGRVDDPDGKTSVAGIKVQVSPGKGINPFGSVRTVTRKQMDRERRSSAKKQKKLTRAQKNGVPSTITAGRPQRRSTNSQIAAERKQNRIRGGVSKSRQIGTTSLYGAGVNSKPAKKKSKKKSAGTYTR